MNSGTFNPTDHTTPAAKLKGVIVRSLTITAVVSVSIVCLPAYAQNIAVTTTYLTGTWKDTPQCAGPEATIFFANGTISSAGSIPVNYTVTGPSQFTMYGSGGAISIQAQYLNQNQMVITLQNKATVFYRCGTTNASSGQNTQINAAFLVGGWGYNGNCGVREVFYNNGSFLTSQNDTGAWTLNGNVLRMMPNTGSNLDFLIQANGTNNMQFTQINNGQISQYVRCF